jgi:hypothetical protein
MFAMFSIVSKKYRMNLRTRNKTLCYGMSMPTIRISLNTFTIKLKIHLNERKSIKKEFFVVINLPSNRNLYSHRMSFSLLIEGKKCWSIIHLSLNVCVLLCSPFFLVFSTQNCYNVSELTCTCKYFWQKTEYRITTNLWLLFC